MGNWLEIISTYLEIYSLNIEVMFDGEMNELKNFRILLLKSFKGKQVIVLNERWTLLFFVIMCKTMIPLEGTVFFRKLALEVCENVKNNLTVRELDYGLETNCSRVRKQQTTDQDDNEIEALRKTIDGKLKRQVVKVAQVVKIWEKNLPFFGRKTGPSMIIHAKVNHTL